MKKELYLPDLICAESSPVGLGGVSVIRVSGEGASALFRQLFFKDSDFSHRCVYFKKYFDKEEKFLDEVIAFSFDDKKSFTGEPSFEIQCHGSPLVVKSILSDLYVRGVRLAEPGEFSYRSYLNEKMDLVKAESIHHLIHSQSKTVREMSLNLLEGKFNNDLNLIKDHLLLALSRLEAMIDFSEQDIDLEQEEIIKKALGDASHLYKEYTSSFKYSHAHLEGLKVCLVGPPNSGKSSLFNVLLKDERSIVSDIAGTTRDYISETAFFDEHSYKLIDTAGLRESSDSIEELGIKKSSLLAEKAQLLLLLVSYDTMDDFKRMLEDFDESLLKKSILIKTKSDLESFEFSLDSVRTSLSLSIHSLEDLDKLKVLMKKELAPYLNIDKGIFIERQFDLISRAKEALDQASELSISGHEDIISSLLYKSLSLVDELLYIDDPESVRDKIFNDFCLGK